MLFFGLPVLVRPESDHLEEDLLADPSEQQIARSPGFSWLEDDLCSGVHADRGQAGLGQGMH